MSVFSVHTGPDTLKSWGENKLADKLQHLAEADKKSTWLHRNISVRKSGFLGRIFWAIAKHFDWMRRAFYDIDLERSKAILLELQPQIAAQNESNPALCKLYKAAISTFNSIAPNHHIALPSEEEPKADIPPIPKIPDETPSIDPQNSLEQSPETPVIPDSTLLKEPEQTPDLAPALIEAALSKQIEKSEPSAIHSNLSNPQPVIEPLIENPAVKKTEQSESPETIAPAPEMEIKPAAKSSQALTSKPISQVHGLRNMVYEHFKTNFTYLPSNKQLDMIIEGIRAKVNHNQIPLIMFRIDKSHVVSSLFLPKSKTILTSHELVEFPKWWSGNTTTPGIYALTPLEIENLNNLLGPLQSSIPGNFEMIFPPVASEVTIKITGKFIDGAAGLKVENIPNSIDAIFKKIAEKK